MKRLLSSALIAAALLGGSGAMACSLCPRVAVAASSSSLYRISVSGMVCSFCAQGVEKRLKAVAGIEAVRIDLSNGMVEVTARSGAALDTASLKQAIRDAGYDVRRIDRVASASAATAGKPN
jgi:mercuric ion binding protein